VPLQGNYLETLPAQTRHDNACTYVAINLISLTNNGL